MKYYADSSFIVKLYDSQVNFAEIESIRRFLKEGQKVIFINELCHVEILNVLLRKDDKEAIAAFENDLLEGRQVCLESVNWHETFQQAKSLILRFSRTLKPGSHDLVLVAAAVTAGASWFLSFDRNSRQRPLAMAAGLQVWPPLNKDEKGLARFANT